MSIGPPITPPGNFWKIHDGFGRPSCAGCPSRSSLILVRYQLEGDWTVPDGGGRRPKIGTTRQGVVARQTSTNAKNGREAVNKRPKVPRCVYRKLKSGRNDGEAR